MKKILAILVIMSMISIAAPFVSALDEFPAGDCASVNCNPAFVYDPTNPGSTAATIGTTATVGTATGSIPPTGGSADVNAPIIKCKWEYDREVIVNLADCPTCTIPSGCHDPGLWCHDACPCIEGLQVKPDLGETTWIDIYAVVYDPQGVATVERVYADIWHPDGQFKMQVELEPMGVTNAGYINTPAMAEWDHALNCHDGLITINDGWAASYTDPTYTAKDDITDEIAENMAYVYHGEAEISYCQPGGWYTVGIIAFDIGNLKSDYVYNKFWYIPVAAVDIDFNTIDYGSINIGYRKQVGGDDQLDTPTKPTVRNIGNTPVTLWVNQTDMLFGKTGSMWNVHFDARMGLTGLYVEYDPKVEVEIPGILPLCTQDKLDFGITATKGTNGLTYTGTMTLKACIDMADYIWSTPNQWVQTAPLGVAQDLTP